VGLACATGQTRISARPCGSADNAQDDACDREFAESDRASSRVVMLSMFVGRDDAMRAKGLRCPRCGASAASA
jgi:hypothetical protein